jgi:hypothetical protein
LWSEIGLSRIGGDEVGEGTITGVLRPLRIEIDNEGITGGESGPEGRERTEQSVLRRPHGERRH